MALISFTYNGNPNNMTWTAPADCVVNIMCNATELAGSNNGGISLIIDGAQYGRISTTGESVYICGEPVKAGKVISTSCKSIYPVNVGIRIAGFTV